MDQEKLFGKYHQLFLLAVGFILTTILGGILGNYFQNKSWKHQNEIRLINAERDAATRLFDELSRMIDKRYYEMRQLAYKLTFKQISDVEEQMDKYREILSTWNGSLNRNRALTRRYFGNNIENIFMDEIHREFKEIGILLENDYGLKKRNAKLIDIELIDGKFEELEREILEFNIQIISDIQNGNVGLFREEQRK